MTLRGDLAAGATPATTEWRPFSADLVAGSSRRDITPASEIRTANWGAHGRHEVATGVHQPLTVTALALADDSGSMHYVVSTDLGWWRNTDDEQSVRAPVLEALDVGESRLLLHLVHTHAGPCTTRSQHFEPGGALVDSYLRSVSDAIVAACREARATARPCRITWGTGACALATVRDLPCGDLDVVGFNPDVAADDTVIVGRVTDHDERTVATILNYACHPTTLAWQNPLLSPDFVGPARVLVETATSAPCLFLQGASGDLAPPRPVHGRHRCGRAQRTDPRSRRPVDSRSDATTRPHHALQRGRRIRRQPRHMGASPGPLPHRAQSEAHPSPRAPSAAAVARRAHPTLEPPRDTPARERVERAMGLRKGYVDNNSARHPVWIMEVGDAIVVAHPGEAYSAMQTELRSRPPPAAASSWPTAPTGLDSCTCRSARHTSGCGTRSGRPCWARARSRL